MSIAYYRIFINHLHLERIEKVGSICDEWGCISENYCIPLCSENAPPLEILLKLGLFAKRSIVLYQGGVFVICKGFEQGGRKTKSFGRKQSGGLFSPTWQRAKRGDRGKSLGKIPCSPQSETLLLYRTV